MSHLVFMYDSALIDDIFRMAFEFNSASNILSREYVYNSQENTGGNDVRKFKICFNRFDGFFM